MKQPTLMWLAMRVRFQGFSKFLFYINKYNYQLGVNKNV